MYVTHGLGEDIFLLFFRGTGHVLPGVSSVWSKISLSYNTVNTSSIAQSYDFLFSVLFLSFLAPTPTLPHPWSLLEDPKSENGSFSTDSQIDPFLNRPLKYLITPKNVRKHKEREKWKKDNESD